MCFSANVSLATGVVVGGAGAATIPFIHQRREVAFATLPLVFSAHQLLEGIVWRHVDAAGGTAVSTPVVLVWQFVAWTFLPIYVPFAVALFEPDRRRRQAMWGLTAVGAGIGTFLLVTSIDSGSRVQIAQHHLQYDIPLHPGWLPAIPYVAATCLSVLLSSHPFVVRFGIALTASMALSAAMDALNFSSVWCFFAAVLSLGILVHYRTASRESRAGLRPADAHG